MDASGCLEENEKSVEKKKETIESNVDKAVRRRGCARLYLCHTFLTPGTFPLEESFSPPAGIRPCWMNFSKCFRICNGTTIEQIFLSVSLSLLFLLHLFLLRGNKFSRVSLRMWKHRARRNIFRWEIVPRHFFAISYVLQERDDSLEYLFFARSTIFICTITNQESFMAIIFYNPGWNWRRALQFLAWFLFLLIEPTSFHAINHTFKARSWRTFEG